MSDAWGGETKEEGSVHDDAADDVAPAAPVAPAKAYSKEQVLSHGWHETQGYDYSRYARQDRHAPNGADGADGAVAEGHGSTAGSAAGDGEIPTDSPPADLPQWASGEARYEWNDEYGDVGPAFPELEKILFGDEDHVRAGSALVELNKIKVVQEGTIRIDPVMSFDNAGLHPVMRENVRLAGYETPTTIQSYALPAIYKGHDIVACAQTGSGKTAAFFIPTLSKLMGKAKKLAAPRPNPATFREGIDAPVTAEPLMLVVCPNRELAIQIFNEARRFCYRSMLRPCVIYGGGPTGEQARQLAKGCDVLIGTPGRLCDFIEKPHILSLRRLKYMVIDEADELLNEDWTEELGKIMSGGDQEEGNITYMMFSATFPKIARDLAKEHLAHDYVRLRVGRAGSHHQNVVQNVVFVNANMKRQALIDLLMTSPPARTIIFVNSKRTADEIDDYLFNLGLPCTSIHSDRTQLEREDALRAFRKGEKPILVATGVSARGLDVHNVMHVVNYDLPSNMYGGLEEYTHRIGRTARIGNKGLATSFYNDRNEDLGQELTHYLQESKQQIPDFLEQYQAEDGDDIHFEADSEDEEEGGDGEEDKKSEAADAASDAGDAASEASIAVSEPAAPVFVAPKAPVFVAPKAPAFVAPKAPVFTAPAPPAFSADAYGGAAEEDDW